MTLTTGLHNLLLNRLFSIERFGRTKVMDFSLLGLWNQMGFVARAVVVLLIAMSMYAIGIGLERFITYRRSRLRSIAFLRALEPLIRSREKLDQASQLGKIWQDAPLARIVETGLQEYQVGLQELGG